MTRTTLPPGQETQCAYAETSHRESQESSRRQNRQASRSNHRPHNEEGDRQQGHQAAQSQESHNEEGHTARRTNPLRRYQAPQAPYIDTLEARTHWPHI